MERSEMKNLTGGHLTRAMPKVDEVLGMLRVAQHDKPELSS